MNREEIQQTRENLIKKAQEDFKLLPKNDIVQLCSQISNYVKKQDELDELEQKLHK